jgi:hypothetical protein
MLYLKDKFVLLIIMSEKFLQLFCSFSKVMLVYDEFCPSPLNFFYIGVVFVIYD